MDDELERALSLLGPLEGRIMRVLWEGTLGEQFVVRDLQAFMPELAYTTLMTTVTRLADKGLLEPASALRRRAYVYRPAHTPASYLAASGAKEFGRLFERYGDTAVAAFAASFDDLSPEQRARLRKLLEER